MSLARSYWAPQAWVDGGWRDGVLLRADASGRWAEVAAGVTAAPAGAAVLDGPVLASLVDAHSHAFQRAMAGLAEQREAGDDDFWSWRDRMYRVALRITPEQMRAVAAQLYVELLRGGYTQVCEFHYLQHRPDGSAHDDLLAMSWALADAAADAGLGLTLMPALYERAGFTQPELRDDQRRFRAGAQQVVALAAGVRAARRPMLAAGLAIHSLRAASPDAVRTLLRLAEGDAGPLHLHVAEQVGEVADSLEATGARPIEWLARQGLLDARWQLVHATHAEPHEIEAVARSGAGVVICPSTEANLGDGLTDLPRWLAEGVPISIGSDSQVTRSWIEELRWLDYGQRLALRQRNVAADPPRRPSTAARLYDLALGSGAAPAGLARWGLVEGARADFLVLDPSDPCLAGVPLSHRLDALVFTSPTDAIREVYVAAERVVAERRHRSQAAIAARFGEAMHELWGEAAAPVER